MIIRIKNKIKYGVMKLLDRITSFLKKEKLEYDTKKIHRELLLKEIGNNIMYTLSDLRVNTIVIKGGNKMDLLRNYMINYSCIINADDIRKTGIELDSSISCFELSYVNSTKSNKSKAVKINVIRG